jgi:ribosomal protein L1
MNEDKFNMEIRKFLKQVGVTSQREIEHIVMKAIESGQLNGTETLEVKMTLEAPAIGSSHCIEGTIAME